MRIRVNGVELFVDVHGPALGRREGAIVEKPVLLALHGGPGLDPANLVPWLAPLAERVQILYVDHRGNGRSGRPLLEECTLDVMADDLEALRRLLGLGPLIVLGVSFGGMIGLTYALRHPAGVARLIGCVTAASGDFVDDGGGSPGSGRRRIGGTTGSAPRALRHPGPGDPGRAAGDVRGERAPRDQGRERAVRPRGHRVHPRGDVRRPSP